MDLGNRVHRPPSSRRRALGGTTELADLIVVPRPHLGLWLATVVVIVLAVALVAEAINNPNFEWGVVGDYLFSSAILDGLKLTIILSLVGVPVSIVLGLVVALARLSRSAIVRPASAAYIWFMLAIPLLVQVIFWFNLGALFPTFQVPLPFGVSLIDVKTTALITPFASAIIALSLHESAYLGEIIRGGILSVPSGQIEAAESIGLTPTRIIFRIILPQALRFIVPPGMSRVITYVKNTSLISVAGLTELLHSTQLIYARTYQTIPLLIVASIWYLVLTSVLSLAQHWLELKFGQKSSAGQ